MMLQSLLPLLFLLAIRAAPLGDDVIDYSDKPTFFPLYGPERSVKQWAAGVVTGCRNKKHLAFTFDDGVKYAHCN